MVPVERPTVELRAERKKKMRKKNKFLSFFSLYHPSSVVGMEMTYNEIQHSSATSFALGALYSRVMVHERCCKHMRRNCM